ncbi:MAG: hypothetical protein QI223_00735 [Candidatus Korarchaeota archaeon]|nr:hypothetical protein [Candidatus Korarchaeota archaeon]
MAKEKVTLVLPSELWEKSKETARQQGTSTSGLVARALAELIGRMGIEARVAAGRRIAARRLPVASPEQMEAEIAAGAMEQ